MNVLYDSRTMDVRYGRTIDDVRRLCVFHGLRCGSPQCLVGFSQRLAESQPFRTDLSSLLRATRDLQPERTTADEMLAVMLTAIAGDGGLAQGTAALESTSALLSMLIAGVGGWSEASVDHGPPSQVRERDLLAGNPGAVAPTRPGETIPDAPADLPSAPDVSAFVRSQQAHSLRREPLSEVLRPAAAPNPVAPRGGASPAAQEVATNSYHRGASARYTEATQQFTATRDRPSTRPPQPESSDPPAPPERTDLEQMVRGMAQHIEQMERRISELQSRTEHSTADVALVAGETATLGKSRTPATPVVSSRETSGEEVATRPVTGVSAAAAPTSEGPREAYRYDDVSQLPQPEKTASPTVGRVQEDGVEHAQQRWQTPVWVVAAVLLVSLGVFGGVRAFSHRGSQRPGAAVAAPPASAPSPAPPSVATSQPPVSKDEAPADAGATGTLPNVPPAPSASHAPSTAEQSVATEPVGDARTPVGQRTSAATSTGHTSATKSDSVHERQTDTVAAEDLTRGPIYVPEAVMNRQMLASRPPAYPVAAREQNITGTVVLNAFVARDGTVRRTDVVQGPPALLSSAIASASWRRYRPFLLHGKAVEVQTPLTFHYDLP